MPLPARSRRSRGLRLPEWLACAGVAAAACWPWTPGSSSQLILVSMCLLPLAVRTLLRWEDLADTGAPRPAGMPPDADAYRASFDRALVGLALLEALPPQGCGSEQPVAVRVLQVNRALRELVGGDPAGQLLTELLDPAHRQGVAAALTGLLDGSLPAWRGESSLARLDDGACRWLHLGLVPLPRQDGVPVRISLQATDVTTQREQERRLRRSARHDELTGLPDRALLVDRLGAALADAARALPRADQTRADQTSADQTSADQTSADQTRADQTGADQTGAARTGAAVTGRRARVAVLCCELDGVRTVDDRAGDAAGDAALVAVAQRLRAAVRPGDTVARSAGDTFLVLCPRVQDAVTARRIASRLATAMSQPFDGPAGPLALSLNIGVALAWPDATAAQLLARAEAARCITSSPAPQVLVPSERGRRPA